MNILAVWIWPGGNYLSMAGLTSWIAASARAAPEHLGVCFPGLPSAQAHLALEKVELP
jgi:hypothetical protein